MWDENGRWNHKIKDLIGAENLDELDSIQLIMNRSDKPIWKLTSNGRFSLKSAWNHIDKEEVVHQICKFFWNTIYHLLPQLSCGDYIIICYH